jgi:nitrite reductase/ring-hydroxylating ferredoxin subunit
MKENTVDRRQFMRTMGILPIVSGAVVMSLCTTGCSDDDDNPTSPLTGETVTLTLANEPTLLEVGGFIRRAFGANKNGNRPVIVVRTAQDKFRAMSSYCPHEGGSIGIPSGNKAICPSHGAEFGTSEGNFAQNIGGQSSPSAQTFAVTYDQNAKSITIEF